MRLVRLLGIFALLFPLCTWAQSGTRAWSARTQALSGADVADADDGFAANAALRPDSTTLLNAGFAPVPDGLEGSWTATAAALYAIDGLNRVGASFNRYQYQTIYAADALAAQYARTFVVDSTRRSAGGIRIRYTEQTFGENYLPVTGLSIDMGATFDLLPQVRMGVAVTHAAELYANQGIEQETRTEYFGLSYHPTNEFAIDAAMETNADVPPAFHVAVEYALDRHVTVRAGTETATSSISAGLGIWYSDIRLDFALVRHPELGTSLSFGMGYQP